MVLNLFKPVSYTVDAGWCPSPPVVPDLRRNRSMHCCANFYGISFVLSLRQPFKPVERGRWTGTWKQRLVCTVPLSFSFHSQPEQWPAPVQVRPALCFPPSRH